MIFSRVGENFTFELLFYVVNCKELNKFPNTYHLPRRTIVAKVMFTVSYEIPEAARAQYLALIAQLKPLLNSNGTAYNVYEIEHKKNQFQEVYIYPNEDAYEAADDAENPQADALVEQIYALARDHKVSYSAAIEAA
jgi:hypothetical protein